MSATGFVIVRPGELALKGGNRPRFENILAQNLARALCDHGSPRVERRWGRMYAGPVADARRVAKAAARVFGVASTSPARRTANDWNEIVAAARTTTASALERVPRSRVRFRVTIKRADKTFPLRSSECAAELGATLLGAFDRLVVDLERAELDLGVEIRPEGSFVFTERVPGPGGLPVGSQDRVLCLLSGGLDSPVAAWLAMKRGCRVDFLHFESRPFTGPGSLEKARSLARALCEWQRRGRFFVAPFAEVQVATKALPRPGYRTLVYRRFMIRIAAALARREGIAALVTGDSLGQVASQTLPNLAVVDEASGAFPVLRPLLTFDKEETMRLARRIGTYETSIRPFDDCCTLFQPEHPVTRGRADRVREIEARVDVPGLVASALERCVRLDTNPAGGAVPIG